MAKVLTVTVIEGRDLAAKDKTGFSDPYVKVTVGAQKKKTNKILQTLNPQWNESLTFENVDDRMRVDMKCMDWDKIGGHDFMGEISIPSSDLHEAYTSGNPVEKWYPLMRRKDKDVVTGDIKIRLAFVANVPAPHISGPSGGKPASNAHLSPAEVDAKIQSLMKQREALDSMAKAYERSGDAKSAQVSSQQVAQIDSELAQLRQQQGGSGGAPPPQPPPQQHPQMTHQPSSHPLPPPTQVNVGGGSAPPPPPPPPGPGGAVHHPQPTHGGVPPQPGHVAPQPGFGAPQPGYGAPQPGFGVPHHPSTGMMQPGGPTPPPRGVSNGGMVKVPTHGSSNRLSGMGGNPTVVPNQGGLPLPNHQPSERRLSGGMGGGNPKMVPPRQQPPTPPQPGMNTGGAPQPPTRNLPTPGGNRPMPPTTPPPHHQVPQKPRVRVLYEFPAENPGELHVKEGDILEIDNADDTWFTATKNGVTGWFPTNYAERI